MTSVSGSREELLDPNTCGSCDARVLERMYGSLCIVATRLVTIQPRRVAECGGPCGMGVLRRATWENSLFGSEGPALPYRDDSPGHSLVRLVQLVAPYLV